MTNEDCLLEIKEIKSYEELYKWAQIVAGIGIEIVNSNKLSNKKIFIKNCLDRILLEKEKELNNKFVSDTKINYANVLSKNLLDGKAIISLIETFKQNNRYIGSIPKEFLSNIEPKNKSDCAKQILDLFSFYAMELNYDFKEDTDLFLEQTGRELDKTLKQFESHLSKIINKDVKISYIGRGCNGNAYKLVIDGKAFCYKVYIAHCICEFSAFNSHGACAEPSFGYFATKNGKKKQFVKFIFGKIASDWQFDAFSVSEFIQRNPNFKRDEIFKLDYLTISVSETRKRDNVINAIIVDTGGIKEAVPEMAPKPIRSMVRVICQSINYKYDDYSLRHIWNIRNKNFKTLKNYVIAQKDWTNYITAVKLIADNFIYFPQTLKDDLLNLQNLNDDYFYSFSESFGIEDLFQTEVDKIESKANYYKLRIKTKSDPVPAFNMPGNMILKLTEEYIAIVLYDDKKEVYEIRIEKIYPDLSMEVMYKANGAEQIRQTKDIYSDESDSQTPFYLLLKN